MQKETLKVEGMSCNHCVKSIETGLKEMGVAGTVDLQGGIVQVQYDEGKVNMDQIKHAIEELGYEVV